MDAQAAYDALLAETREIALLGSVNSVLGWDERTYMPKRAAGHRADQSSLLAKLAHARFTAPRVGELLHTVESSRLVHDAESDAAANVREIRRAYDRATKLPTALVEELTRTAVHGEQAWGEAKRTNDFPSFQPWLEKLLKLKRQEADCVAHPSGDRYNALLDEFEPGMSAEAVRQTFEQLRARLVELVGRVMESGRRAPFDILQRHYPAAAQERLSRAAAAAVGFDFDAGRLDATIHPFCTGIGPGDTRLTTRYDEDYVGDGFFSTLHEAGHGLYEQGLPAAHFGTPLGEAASLGVHESQSRMWENLVGRSRAFWRFFLPQAKAAFPGVLDDVDLDRWHFAVNDVRPSLIRTEADEATYNLHVMLRFEIERALLGGELAPADLPGAWNERMRQYLGVTPPDDTHGCLQDVHWSGGAIGYFPTYTLGNLYAAQFFEQVRTDLGDLDAQFARGEFAPLLGWLREKIHRHGKRYTAGELAQRVTGKPLDAGPLLRHLRTKAAELYGV